MDKQLFVFLLIAHVLADFHFQPPGIARKKNYEVSAFFVHALLVFILTIGVAIFYYESDLLISLSFIAASHILVDYTKSRLIEHWPKLESYERGIFWIDQVIHLLVILAVILELDGLQLRMHDRDTVYRVSKLVLGFLLLTKAANIMISLSTKAYHYEEQSQLDTVIDVEKGKAGAGALIGSLERILSAILLVSGQIAAIGLIFTAKSIARFDRIQKDQRFAEYYLIGSLSSLLISFLVHGFLFYLI